MSSETVELAPAAERDRRGAARVLRVGAPLGRRWTARLLALLVLLLVWWLIAELKIWPPLFVPPPQDVWDRLVDGERDGISGYYLHQHAWASLWRVLRGVGLALPFGVLLGLFLATVRPAQLILEPYVNFVRALPPLGYFSLLIIWFGIDDAAKVWLLFLASFPPITIAVLGGVRGIRRERIDALLALGANRWQVMRHVVLPSVLPDVFTGLRLSIGFAWTTIVAAETINGVPGLGGLAWQTTKFQQTDVAVLCVVLIGLLAVALDLVVKAVERVVVPWRGKA